MLVRTDTNKTLKGHKLLIIAPWQAPAGFLEKLAAAFPDLQVVYHVHSLATTPPSTDAIPDQTWRDVTILLTFNTLPTPEQAPKLQYVQLLSAGANHVLNKPVFKDTEVAFCTANGVHGNLALRSRNGSLAPTLRLSITSPATSSTRKRAAGIGML
ncbi:hypothetical protein VTG60DRAFT_3082 [Thermothelomyces hinnuleus]